MKKKVYIIDGNNFSNFYGFCEEFSKKVLLGKHVWKGNLDAFNDILFGGFGDIEDGEEYVITWENFNKSRKDLSYAETIIYLEEILHSCHPSNISKVSEKLKMAKEGYGTTIFDALIEIIGNNNNVTLILE